MRIVFIATGDIALPTLQLLLESSEHHLLALVTQPDRLAGRNQQLRAPAVKELAAKFFVPIYQPERIRESTAVDQIRFLRPDLIVVMAYGQILPETILQIPAIACLNLHASLLPGHRGAAPIQAAIASGDPVSGITVMHMSKGLDTGDVLLRRELQIRRRETGGSLHDRLAEIAPVALTDAMALLKSGNAPREVQSEQEASYAPKLSREDGLIDWTQSNLEIDRRIRANTPWPGAYTLITDPHSNRDRKLKIFSTIVIRHASGKPGEVLSSDKHGLLIGCGLGALLLREMQLEGRSKLKAKEFLIGTPFPLGTLLGPGPVLR